MTDSERYQRTRRDVLCSMLLDHSDTVKRINSLQTSGETYHVCILHHDRDEYPLMNEFDDGFYVVNEGYMEIIEHFTVLSEAIAFAKGYLSRGARTHSSIEELNLQ